MAHRIAFILSLVLLAVSIPARGGPGDVSRVLQSINFEERRLGNREDLPMHWNKVEGPGLPHYVNGKLSDDRAHTGSYSFRFDLNGGSLIYRYDSGQIPVQTGAHYHVDGYALTTALPHARARMSAYFVDADGHEIDGTVVHSELFASKSEDEDWHQLSIELTAADPHAAFVVIELALLQPALFAPNSLGDRTLYPQDIHGTAWFDDITVSQVPEVFLGTGRPGNIFRRSDPLRLTVVVNDRFIGDLASQLLITDAVGKVIYQHSGALDMTAAETLVNGEKRIAMDLPDLKPGWYDAALEMTSQGQSLGKQDLHLVRLADDAIAARPDARFGVIATNLPFGGWAELPEILPMMSAGRVKLSVWSAAGDIEQVDPLAFDNLLSRLQAVGITPTACLTGLPPNVARKVGGDSWGLLVKAPPETWQPDLAILIARHANHLDRWQFGDDVEAADFLQKPEMRQVYDLLYKEFATLIDKPDLAMPWPAWYDLSGQLPATVALSVPPEVLPSQLPLYIQGLHGDGHHLSITLQLLDDRYGREVQICDLAQRVVYALAGEASRIDLPLPFTLRKSGNSVSDEPLEQLMIIRTLATQLAGATFKGKVPIANDVDAFLFDRAGQGVLVLWTRGQQGGPRKLQLNLSENATRMDLWGNAMPVVQADGAKADTVLVDVGPMPFVLIGVDLAVAQMRASVGFDQPLLESSFQPHTRHIHFTNSGGSTISGSMKLTGPKGWLLTPSVFSFSLDPGEVFDRDVTIEFPYNSFAGAKTVTADFQVQGEKNTQFSVPIVMSLGLSDVGMQTMALRDKNDLIVQQMISNYGDQPIDYTAFAVYPGQARQERLVTHLGPGRTIIKLYRFPNVTFIPNAKVRSGLKEVEGTRILNSETEIQ
jgi:hypothetical protein